MSGVSGDFPVHLATRLRDWSVGGLLRCSAARLSVCRCRSAKYTSTTRTTCCGHPREDVTRMLRGKLLPWNLSLIVHSHTQRRDGIVFKWRRSHIELPAQPCPSHPIRSQRVCERTIITWKPEQSYRTAYPLRQRI